LLADRLAGGRLNDGAKILAQALAWPHPGGNRLVDHARRPTKHAGRSGADKL
jgi:hypothetical protein